MRTWPTSGHYSQNKRALSKPWCLRDALNNPGQKIKLTSIGSRKDLKYPLNQTWLWGCSLTNQLVDWFLIISRKSHTGRLTWDRPQKSRKEYIPLKRARCGYRDLRESFQSRKSTPLISKAGRVQNTTIDLKRYIFTHQWRISGIH